MTNDEQDREIRLMRRAIVRIDKSVVLIKQAVCGNGTKGLNARVTELENGKKAKPARQLAVLGGAVAVGGLLFKGIELAAKWLGR